MTKKGLLTIGSGIIAVLASALFGWGPCGPASLPGFVLFYGGVLTSLFGCGTVGIGLIRNLIRRAMRF